MGLAASQARLLLLTASKSDLEYRAQLVSQRKLTLAMETESIAKEYTQALNNTTLTFEYFDNPNDPDAETKGKTVTLDYKHFCNSGGSQYRLRSAATGQIVCLDAAAEATRHVNRDNYLQKEGATVKIDDKEYVVGKGGVINTGTDDKPVYQLAYDDTAYNAALESVQKNMLPMPALSNTEALQYMLQSGQLIIEKVTNEREQIDVAKPDETGGKPSRAVVTWDTISLSGMPDVASTYDTSDDGPAESKYQYESLRVQTKDKQLDVELKQIETQQKACESEIDAVKKVLQNNVEKSFKYFS